MANPEIKLDGPLFAPHLVCAGAADAIAFYEKAFGAEPLMRMDGPDGTVMHASLNINGAMVTLVDENRDMGMLGPKALGGTAVTLHLKVDDVDAWAARAQAAGATVVLPVADMFWGDRYGIVEDPFGHRWSMATPYRDTPLTEEELKKAAAEAMCTGA
jgi:uncharacterized glyoxalase superfamily protein PhnB